MSLVYKCRDGRLYLSDESDAITAKKMPQITFRPILTSEKHVAQPHCYYLEIEEARILLDCGTWENGEVEAGLDGFDEQSYIDTLRESVAFHRSCWLLTCATKTDWHRRSL